MFGKKKVYPENGSHERLLKAFKHCLKDDEKVRKLSELLECTQNNVKADFAKLNEYIKLLEYLSNQPYREETRLDREFDILSKRGRFY